MLRTLVVLLLGVSALGQTNAVKPPEVAAVVPAYAVKLVPDRNVSVAYDDRLPVGSGQCGADGSPYLYLLGPSGKEAAGFTRNGAVTITSEKMRDIPEPSISRFFIASSAIYVLADGLENAKEEPVTSIDAETNQTLTWSRKTGDQRQYIARFEKDGTYHGALKLDFAFRVMQVGVFESGNYAVAGVDNDKIPRVALLNASGQLQKYVELEKDLGNKPKNAGKTFARTFGEAATDLIAMFANFAAYGNKVLFVRTSTGTPIYEIRDGGEARAITIKPPAGYVLWGLIPSDKTWLADFAKPSATGALPEAENHVVYEVNPETGELMRELRLERDPKIQPACWDGNELTAISHDDNRITVLRGTPEPVKVKSEPE